MYANCFASLCIFEVRFKGFYWFMNQFRIDAKFQLVCIILENVNCLFAFLPQRPLAAELCHLPSFVIDKGIVDSAPCV